LTLTGHIPGTTVLRQHPTVAAEIGKGANQVGLRAANERLVLSLIRAHGQLSKAQIAELTGLTAQTASVISRGLVEAGLLNAGARVAGKVGQPYVPLGLNPDGAMFFGLHIGERESRLALVNFTGSIIEERSLMVVATDLERIVKFTGEAVDEIRLGFDRAQNARVQGLGVSVSTTGPRTRPGPSWGELDAAFSALGHQLGLATYVSSEAAAACSAELIYGLGAGISDFAYVFVAESLSGGLVQNGNIRFSRDDVGSNMGRVLVPAGDGAMVPLRTLAGLTGKRPADAKSLELIARGVAYAVHAAASVVHYDVVIVDGSLPPQTLRHLVLLLRGVLAEFDDKSSSALSVREGSRARKGATLGAACLPLVDRFYPS
jgi:predicted NBD/HSP70 family sugar kinase